MAAVRLLCGPKRSERPAELNALLRGCWGRVLLVVPTAQLVARRTEELLLDENFPGAWNSPIVTFQGLVTRLLRETAIDPASIQGHERRLLIESVVRRLAESGRLEGLGDAALSQGFFSHALRVITQLKQAACEPRAFREAASKRKSYWLDPIMADVYEGYQQALIDAEVYDLVGLYWEANLLCEGGRPPGLEGVDTIVLDGFDDFTPSEFRLLVSVARHVEEMVFSVHCTEENPSQGDLYAIPLETIKRIRNIFRVDSTAYKATPPVTHSQFAADQVFWRDKPPVPPNLDENITLVPCGDALQEGETIARQVKRLLLAGEARVDDIAVVFRSLSDVAPTLRNVFSECGVPVRIYEPHRLEDTATGAFILHFLEAVETWERAIVVDVITSPLFLPAEIDIGRAKECAHYFSKAAQIIEGHDQWTRRLSRLRERLTAGRSRETDATLARIPHARDAIDQLLASLEILRSFQEDLGRASSLADMVKVLDDMIRSLDLGAAVETFPKEHAADVEGAALDALYGILRSLYDWLQKAPRAKRRSSDFRALLRQAFKETAVNLSHRERGVAILDLETVRHQTFDYVFFAAANEGEFPRPQPESAIYSEEDMAFFAREGIELETSEVRADRERILFHHLLNVPRKRLWVSWRTQSRDGRESLPSPFVGDLDELFEGGLPTLELSGAAFVPSPEAISSARDLANATFVEGSLLRSQFAQRFGPVGHAATLEDARQDRSPFGIYDAVLQDPDLIAYVAGRYDEEHSFSVNQLEAYAECPFQFFVQRLLGVEESEVPTAEFDRRVRGSLLHGVLERFHEEYRGKTFDEIDGEEAVHLMQQLVEEVFKESAWRSATTSKGVRAAEKRSLLHTLLRYLAIQREGGKDKTPWRPSHFETAFGKVTDPSRDELNTPEPFVLETTAGPVRFAGKIDRIDLHENDARIVDYKTTIFVGRSDIDSGVALQLPVYALALERHLLPSHRCREAMLLQVGQVKTLDAWKKGKRPELEKIVCGKVAEYVQGIRAGRFPPDPYRKTCYLCVMNRVCRFDENRIERKKDAP